MLKSFNQFSKKSAPVVETAPTVVSGTQIIEPKKPSKHGIVGLSSFFDWLSAIISRIAYIEDPMTLFLLSGVFKIIPNSLLTCLQQITDIKDLENDDKILSILASLDPTEQSKIKIVQYGGKRYIDFLDYSIEINHLIDNPTKSSFFSDITDPEIMVISIADSNYGDILVIGIGYLPNFIYVAYRGTYSTKTAQSYLQINSIYPKKVNGMKILKGISKIQLETVYTTYDAMRYISEMFLNNKLTDGKKIIPVFTGHSLGGAMATLLTYEYCKGTFFSKIRSDILSTNCICVSFGAPRVLSIEDSEELCKFAVDYNVTLIHRYSNKADPVTSLPPNKAGFSFAHPCSSANDKTKRPGKDFSAREKVARDCDSAITTLQNFDYSKSLNCTNSEPTLASKVFNAGPNMLHHTNYLYINFRYAADLLHLLVGSAVSWETTEVGRVKTSDPSFFVFVGDTELRVILMKGNNNSGIYTMNFVDLTKLRTIPSGSEVPEDTKDTPKVFADIVDDTKNSPVVTFDKNKLPNPFQKKIEVKDLLDLQSKLYNSDVLKEGPIIRENSNAGEIELTTRSNSVKGGKRKRKQKTKKSKINTTRKVNKSKKTNKTKKNKRKSRKH